MKEQWTNQPQGNTKEEKECMYITSAALVLCAKSVIFLSTHCPLNMDSLTFHCARGIHIQWCYHDNRHFLLCDDKDFTG